jgi:hypothetical protein
MPIVHFAHFFETLDGTAVDRPLPAVSQTEPLPRQRYDFPKIEAWCDPERVQATGVQLDITWFSMLPTYVLSYRPSLLKDVLTILISRLVAIV